jgi:hypothetical protein
VGVAGATPHCSSSSSWQSSSTGRMILCCWSDLPFKQRAALRRPSACAAARRPTLQTQSSALLRRLQQQLAWRSGRSSGVRLVQHSGATARPGVFVLTVRECASIVARCLACCTGLHGSSQWHVCHWTRARAPIPACAGMLLLSHKQLPSLLLAPAGCMRRVAEDLGAAGPAVPWMRQRSSSTRRGCRSCWGRGVHALQVSAARSQGMPFDQGNRQVLIVQRPQGSGPFVVTCFE